jgi:hypothetical protein
LLLATAKSPVATGVESVTEVGKTFFRTTVCAALVVPTVVLLNFRLAGETVTGAPPVPVKLTFCMVSLAALSVKIRSPRPAAPALVGENVTPTEHVAPAAMAVPQVLLEIAKGV